MRTRTAPVAALLFGSGFCALVYQVAWLREFRLIFGASTAASAAVLAIFIGGLGLGGWLLGGRADEHPHPLTMYAWLEAIVGGSAALSPLLLWLVRLLYVASDKHSLPAGILHESLGLLGVIVLIQIGNEHVGALARIRDGDRAADPAVRAGDNRLLSGEATRASVGFFAMIGHRLHRVRFAWH